MYVCCCTVCVHAAILALHTGQSQFRFFFLFFSTSLVSIATMAPPFVSRRSRRLKVAIKCCGFSERTDRQVCRVLGIQDGRHQHVYCYCTCTSLSLALFTDNLVACTVLRACVATVAVSLCTPMPHQHTVLYSTKNLWPNDATKAALLDTPSFRSSWHVLCQTWYCRLQACMYQIVGKSVLSLTTPEVNTFVRPIQFPMLHCSAPAWADGLCWLL